MIVSKDYGYTLACTGCKATLQLTLRELADPYKAAERRANMRAAHAECDGFHDFVKAREAIKLKRRAARRAASGGQAQ